MGRGDREIMWDRSSFVRRDDHSSPVVSAAKVGLIWGLLKAYIYMGDDDDEKWDRFIPLHQFLKGLKGEIFFIFSRLFFVHRADNHKEDMKETVMSFICVTLLSEVILRDNNGNSSLFGDAMERTHHKGLNVEQNCKLRSSV